MSPEALRLIIIIAGVFAILGCLIMAFRSLTRKRLIDDTPTSKTQVVFIGLAELKGTAESDTPFTSYLAGARCVYYSWQVQEHWSRTVHETYRDAQGRTQTRTRTESGWKTVASGGQSATFYLKDDTGVIRIVPDGANIESNTIFSETCSPGSPLYFGKGPAQEIANTTHRRQFRETAIPLHAVLYIMGQARERQDVVAAEISRDKDAPMFVISTRTEKQISSRYVRWFWLWLILGLVIAVGGTFALGRIGVTAGMSGVTVQWRSLVIAAGAYVVAVALGWLWTVYNSLVNLHHRVEQAWSQVDVQLKRRNDLIPNLARAVEGYRDYEAGVQKLVTELRGQLAATPPGVAGPDFKGVATPLRVVVERYPNLKASESFLKLQQALSETEQRIALARDYFNETATFFNSRLEIIPDRFVAAIARFRPQSLMAAADFERAPVQVQLVS